MKIRIQQGLVLLLSVGLLLLVGTAGLTQEPTDPKSVARLEHDPRIDSVLEQIFKLSEQGQAQAAAQAASRARVPVSGNMATVIFQLPEGVSIAPVAQELMKKQIANSGGRVLATSKYAWRVQMPMNLGILRTALAQISSSVQFVRPQLIPQTLVISEGVALTGASVYHSNGFRGQGTKIAVIDLGFQGLTTAQSRGELPGGIQTLDYTGSGIESGTNHGTAVAEIVYDMAPQAQLILMKVGDEVDLENAKEEAIRQGAKIINHSVGWFNTNFYDGTGTINNIVADARNRGVLWVNAAGNYGRRHWQGTFRDTNNNKWHEFSGGDESLTITVNAGDPISIFLTWNDWPASGNDYDLYLFNSSGTQVAASQRIQSGTEIPAESLFFQSFVPGTYHIQIKADGNPAPRTFSLFSLNHDVEYPVPSSSIIAPGDSPNALTVGAVNRQNWTTGPLASYSSQGPTNAGLSKPDLVGPDRVSTFTYSEFAGTSAASPHVAGAAALLLSENPNLTAGQLETRLKGDAIPMGSPLQFGSGRLNLSQTSPVRQPDLTLSGLTYSPPNPHVGDFVTVSGIVQNIGNAAAEAFVMEIRDSGGSERRTVTGLNAGGSTSFSFTRRVNQTTETFLVIVDVTNQVSESNESNNSAELRVTATQPSLKPDLTIAGTDWSPRTLTVGQNVTLSIVVRNQGQASAGPFVVEVRDSVGTDRQNFSGLAAGSTATVNFTRRVNNTTEFFTITVDATNQIDELDETNNSAQIRVDAQPQAPRKPDLTIAGVDWTPRTPRLGENVNFTVVVRNQGESAAGPFIIEIRDSAGPERRALSGLGASSAVSLSFTRRQNNSTELFTITVDVTNQVDESNESNNSTQVRIDALAETRLPDLVIDSLDYSPRDPSVGSSLTLTAIVRNIGNADAGAFVVDLQDSVGQTRQALTGLRAGASVRLDFARRLNSSSETFTVAADALRQVAESDETNNSRQITVRSSTPSQLSISISADKTSYRIGDRLQISLRIGAQAYVYVYDVDPAGRVSQVFPNSFSRQNLLGAGVYTLPDGAAYTLVITGPEGTEYLHAVAITQAVNLGLDGTQNTTWLNPEAFRAELTRRIQSAAPSATWTSSFTSFQVGGGTSPQNRAPTACFTFSPTSPIVHQTITFDASCSSDPDGRIARYDWDFNGDGRFDAQGVRAAFAFTQARTYTVLLRVTDDQGLTGSQSKSVVVQTTSTPTPTPRLPYIPLGAGGLFVLGTDQLYLIVQGATGWNSDRPYQISLTVNGSIEGVSVQTEGAATAQPVPQSTGQQTQLTLTGVVRSNGRVIYSVQLSDTISAARLELLLDVNGDGTPERTQTNTIFIFIPGIARVPGFYLPFSNPFIIKHFRNESLLPFDEFTRLCVPAQATGFETSECWPR